MWHYIGLAGSCMHGWLNINIICSFQWIDVNVPIVDISCDDCLSTVNILILRYMYTK
jgi:hypothetical protein